MKYNYTKMLYNCYRGIIDIVIFMQFNIPINQHKTMHHFLYNKD